MIRERLRGLALAGEAVLALRRARRLVRAHPAAIQSMMTGRSTPVPPYEREEAARVARAVARGARFVRPATCLVRAVAGHQLLERRGVTTTVRLGRDTPDGRGFQAHAWLELGGVPILGDPRPDRFDPP